MWYFRVRTGYNTSTNRGLPVFYHHQLLLPLLKVDDICCSVLDDLSQFYPIFCITYGPAICLIPFMTDRSATFSIFPENSNFFLNNDFSRLSSC